MRLPIATIAVVISITANAPARAQGPQADQHAPLAGRFVDSINGLGLDQAIAQALDKEPGLRAARSDVEVARGMRVQAGLKPNPTVALAHQTEPAGTDAQTRVEVQWPLDLFRKTGRVSVAEREIEARQHATADRERLLISDVRLKFGEVLTAVRELAVMDDLVAATARQHALVAARAEEGAAPPLERDMVRVELQRLEADRMLQAGHAEHALIELKRLLGLAADAPLTLREDLEQLVQREIALPVSNAASSTGGRPDLEEARTRIHLADARIEQARRDGWADVSVFGAYTRTDAGFPQRGFGPQNDLERVRGVFHYVAGGLTVSVPLRNRNQGEIAAAQAQRAGAEAQLDATRLTAEAEIAASRARDEHARRALAVYNAETRALAKQNLDVVRQTYELGRMTLFEVLTERRRYLDTERAYTNALREAYDARQALRQALGEVR
jgi:cobalt-zinc-cadmium efflux system outer membrane protein